MAFWRCLLTTDKVPVCAVIPRRPQRIEIEDGYDHQLRDDPLYRSGTLNVAHGWEWPQKRDNHCGRCSPHTGSRFNQFLASSSYSLTIRLFGQSKRRGRVITENPSAVEYDVCFV